MDSNIVRRIYRQEVDGTITTICVPTAQGTFMITEYSGNNTNGSAFHGFYIVHSHYPEFHLQSFFFDEPGEYALTGDIKSPLATLCREYENRIEALIPLKLF